MMLIQSEDTALIQLDEASISRSDETALSRSSKLNSSLLKFLIETTVDSGILTEAEECKSVVPLLGIVKNILGLMNTADLNCSINICLFPVLFNAASKSNTRRAKAIECLGALSSFTACSSQAQFMLENIDYIIHLLSIKLRFERNKSHAPRMLLSVLSIAGIECLPLLNDSFDVLFDFLSESNSESDAEMILDILGTIVAFLKEPFLPDSEIQSAAKDDPFEVFCQQILLPANIKEAEASEETQPNERTNLLFKISEQIINLLSSDSLCIREHVLSILADCLSVFHLSKCQLICPLIFQYWKFIVSRLNDVEISVKFRSLFLIQNLVHFFPEFMNDKIFRDVWPILKSSLKRLSIECSQRIADSLKHSRIIESVVVILSFLELVCRKCFLKYDQLLEMFLNIYPFMDANVPGTVQTATINLVSGMIALDKNLLKYLITRLDQSSPSKFNDVHFSNYSQVIGQLAL
jgi:hypothetical protein